MILYELTGIVIALAIIIITYIKYWVFKYWQNRNVPILNPLRVPFGNLEPPYNRTVPIGVHMRSVYERVKTKYCGLYFLAMPIFFVRDLDLLRLILTKDFQYFTDRGLYYNERDDPISAHLFAIGGVKWRNLRTKLTPTFTSGKMRMMFGTLVECAALMDGLMQTKSGGNKSGEPVDIKNVLACFTTDVIGSCAFGLECNSIQDNGSLFRTCCQRIFQQTKADALKMAFIVNFPGFSKAVGLRITPREIADFFMNVVKDTVQYRETNRIERKDFLQLLIEIKNKSMAVDGVDADVVPGDGKTLTIEEIAAQCFVFFLAGFETSSSLMTFALYELAKNQDLQDKVRREIVEVLKKHDGQITYDSINDMKYMNQVLDEALRKYPPLPFITRGCVQDYKLPDSFGDVTIEKGTRIGIPILGIHYDPEYYPDPDRFDPERFSEQNKQSRHPYSFLPFGEGPRLCIGMRFGLMQSKVGLTTLLRNYKFSVNSRTKTPLKMDPRTFVLAAVGGIWLDMEKLF